MLHDLIDARHDEIVARARASAVRRTRQRRADAELDENILPFLRQLSAALRLSPARPMMLSGDATWNGGRSLRLGFTVSQVVHGYGDICQAVTELALELDAPISADEFGAFNRLLDEAIASALVEYECQREAAILQAGAERLSTLTLAFQSALSTAMDAWGALTIGSADSNEALLDASLQRLQILIDRPLEGSTGTRVLERERVFLHGVILEATIGASVDASRRRLTFFAALPDARTVVLADRQLLVGAVAKIVRHALQFTPPPGRVAVTVREDGGRALIDISTEWSQPAAEASGPLGSELEREHKDFVRRLWPCVSATGGQLSVHDVPERGYVFTLALRTLRFQGMAEGPTET